MSEQEGTVDPGAEERDNIEGEKGESAEQETVSIEEHRALQAEYEKMKASVDKVRTDSYSGGKSSAIKDLLKDPKKVRSDVLAKLDKAELDSLLEGTDRHKELLAEKELLLKEEQESTLKKRLELSDERDRKAARREIFAALKAKGADENLLELILPGIERGLDFTEETYELLHTKEDGKTLTPVDYALEYVSDDKYSKLFSDNSATTKVDTKSDSGKAGSAISETQDSEDEISQDDINKAYQISKEKGDELYRKKYPNVRF